MRRACQTCRNLQRRRDTEKAWGNSPRITQRGQYDRQVLVRLLFRFSFYIGRYLGGMSDRVERAFRRPWAIHVQPLCIPNLSARREGIMAREPYNMGHTAPT